MTPFSRLSSQTQRQSNTPNTHGSRRRKTSSLSLLHTRPQQSPTFAPPSTMAAPARRAAAWAAATAALLSLLGAAVATADTGRYFGRLQVAVVHEKGPHGAAHAPELHKHTDVYYLQLKSGELRLLRFPAPPARLPRSGTRVMVQTRPLEECPHAGGPGGSALCVASIMAHEDAPRDAFAFGQPRGQVKLKALIMQLQVCGQGPAATPEQLSGALFAGLPSSQAETLQGMMATCSYGKAEFSRALGSEVLTATVPIPCSGQTPYYRDYDSATCPFPEWSDVANDYVQRVLGIDWSAYKYKVYVVPAGDLCSWGGMGWVGCQRDCRAWISGDLWMYPATWMHELGHNMYLNHAGSYQANNATKRLSFVGYKDDSAAMGFCCSTRCHNAPHSFQLGWSRPIDTLHKDNFAAGEWRSYTLPPRSGGHSSDKNMLRLVADWSSQSASYNLFLEYRRAEGYDAGLLPEVRDKVTLYSTPLGDAMPYTSLEAVIGERTTLREERLGSRLTIRVGGRSDDGVAVQLCRPAAESERDCGDGRDDDCDGLTDGADPDCRQPHPARRLLLPLAVAMMTPH